MSFNIQKPDEYMYEKERMKHIENGFQEFNKIVLQNKE